MIGTLFPALCVGCQRVLRPSSRLPVCTRCEPELAPLDVDDRTIAGVDALYAYEGPLARAVTRTKFAGDIAGAGPLAALLASAPILSGPWDLWTCVPLHWTRAMARGFNQAELIAARLHGCVRPRGTRFAPRLIRKTRRTTPQSELSAQERLHNLDGSFEVRRRAQLDGKTVLVIDDVTTTGATLQACLATIRRAGAKRVAGLALLRTLA